MAFAAERDGCPSAAGMSGVPMFATGLDLKAKLDRIAKHGVTPEERIASQRDIAFSSSSASLIPHCLRYGIKQVTRIFCASMARGFSTTPSRLQVYR